MLTALSHWINTTAFHTFMVQNPVAFTASETIHFMGLTILAGALLMIDLRGLGFFKSMSFEELHKFVPWAIGGFALNLMTGLAFVFYDPHHYFINLSFQIKMIIIALAGINALVFEFAVFRPYKAGRTEVVDGSIVKASSLLSLLFWGAVLVAGRMIAYA